MIALVYAFLLLLFVCGFVKFVLFVFPCCVWCGLWLWRCCCLFSGLVCYDLLLIVSLLVMVCGFGVWLWVWVCGLVAG